MGEQTPPRVWIQASCKKEHLPGLKGSKRKTDTPEWWSSLTFCTTYVACGATAADTTHQCCRRQGCTSDTPSPLYPTRTFLLHVLAWRGTQTEPHIWEDSRLCPACGSLPHNERIRAPAHELVLYRAMSTHHVLMSCPGIGPSPTLTIPKGYHISPNPSTGCHILGLWFHPQAISVAHIHWTGPRGSVRCRCLHPHRPAPREAQCQSNGLRPADGGTAAGCVCV